MKKIFLIAGEPSGDALGGRLMKALKEQSKEPLEFTGIGGPLMEAQGLKSLIPMQELSVMGLWEVLAHLPKLIKLINGTVEEIEERNPDIVVTIDLPDFNFQVGSRLRKRGTSKAKLVHYVAPSVWAWRKGRAEKVSRFLDGLICLLPFEPPYFPKIKATFAGHPLVEESSKGDGKAFRKSRGIPEGAKTLGLFFGSRLSELKAHGAIIKDVASLMLEIDPKLDIIVPTLPHLELEVAKILSDLKGHVFITSNQDEKQDAIAACDAAIAVSGTIGLELALAEIPHVILYKAHTVTWNIMKLMTKIRRAHLANILLDEIAVPEYLQKDANPVEISKGLLRLYKIDETKAAQIEKVKKLRSILGGDDPKTPSQRAAEFVLSFISDP